MKSLFSILILAGLTLNSSTSLAQSQPPEVEFSSLLSQSGIHILKYEYPEAISCLNACLEINPNSSAACFQLSKIYSELKDFSASLHFAKRAFDLKPQNKTYSLLLASLYEMSGNNELALKFYEKSLPENPTYYDYWYFYNICSDLRFDSQKIETLKKMISIFGYNYELGFQLANDYESIRDLKNAEVEFTKLSCIDSSNIKYLYILKSFYDRNFKVSESQLVQKRINVFSPNSASGQLDDSFIYRASGKMDLFYENLIKSFRNDMSSSFEKKLSLINSFVHSEKFFNLDSVSMAFKVLCETYPNNIVSYQSYYSYLMLIDQVDSAIDVIQKALEIDKSNFSTWLHLFKVLSLTENYQSLFSYTKQAMEYFPELSDVYLYHAVANLYLSDSKTADENFQIAEELGVKYSSSAIQHNFYRGVFYYFMGNKDKAFEFFRNFQKSGLDDYYLQIQYAYFLIDSEENVPLAQSIIRQYANDYNLNYYFYFVRAYFYLKSGNIKQSREDIIKAIAMDNSKYYIYNMAGDIFSRSNDCTNAVIYWNQAIDRGGNSTVIGKKIKNCK